MTREEAQDMDHLNNTAASSASVSNMRGQRIAIIALLFILGAIVGLMVGSRIWP